MKFQLFSLLALAVFVSLPVIAEEKAEDAKPKAAAAAKQDESNKETPAGHSYHGEFLNEGPRQAAYLMGGTGKVRFAVT